VSIIQITYLQNIFQPRPPFIQLSINILVPFEPYIFLVSSSQVYIYNMHISLDTSLVCMNKNMATGTGSPCGACKFLRRRCVSDCVFAPYFSCEQGAARFAAIHKVFGASNISKLLMHLPVADRCEAVVTIAYEAQARIKDPVYGCVAQIFALQQQVCV
jgi:Lateral organ boundaries (LOB) domain